MHPKRLKTPSEKQRVKQMLIDYYYERPDIYGLEERDQVPYDNYADFISSYLTDKSSKLLDFGTGSWRITDTIAKKGFAKVCGLDYFSDVKLKEYSSKLTQSNAELVTYQTPDVIPFPDQEFDSISSLCVIEHIIELEQIFSEMDRVLKTGGLLFIECPNWSGINAAIWALKSNLIKKQRYWLYDSISDSIFGIFRSLKWYVEALLSKPGEFIQIYPRLSNNKLDFHLSDDDTVHLCQPVSLEKYFKSKGYKQLKTNRSSGQTAYSKLFNMIFPSLATTNQLVFKKQ